MLHAQFLMLSSTNSTFVISTCIHCASSTKLLMTKTWLFWCVSHAKLISWSGGFKLITTEATVHPLGNWMCPLLGSDCKPTKTKIMPRRRRYALWMSRPRHDLFPYLDLGPRTLSSPLWYVRHIPGNFNGRLEYFIYLQNTTIITTIYINNTGFFTTKNPFLFCLVFQIPWNTLWLHHLYINTVPS